jgi:hypothetical protein
MAFSILAVDPAKENTGVMYAEVNTAKGVDGSNLPTWLKRISGQGTNKTIEPKFRRHIASGVSNYDIVRIQDTPRAIHRLVQEYKPTALVLESALDVGKSKNLFHFALANLLVEPYYDIGNSPFPGPQYHRPKYVVLVRPERLQSMAHEERSTTGTVTVERYRELTGDKSRISCHEADAYFLIYHMSRFILTCIEKVWPEDWLTMKEKEIFKLGHKPMIDRTFFEWWDNSPSRS